MKVDVVDVVDVGASENGAYGRKKLPFQWEKSMITDDTPWDTPSPGTGAARGSATYHGAVAENCRVS